MPTCVDFNWLGRAGARLLGSPALWCSVDQGEFSVPPEGSAAADMASSFWAGWPKEQVPWPLRQIQWRFLMASQGMEMIPGGCYLMLRWGGNCCIRLRATGQPVACSSSLSYIISLCTAFLISRGLAIGNVSYCESMSVCSMQELPVASRPRTQSI